jgi:hypothetical protein
MRDLVLTHAIDHDTVLVIVTRVSPYGPCCKCFTFLRTGSTGSWSQSRFSPGSAQPAVGDIYVFTFITGFPAQPTPVERVP